MNFFDNKFLLGTEGNEMIYEIEKKSQDGLREEANVRMSVLT